MLPIDFLVRLVFVHPWMCEKVLSLLWHLQTVGLFHCARLGSHCACASVNLTLWNFCLHLKLPEAFWCRKEAGERGKRKRAGEDGKGKEKKKRSCLFPFPFSRPPLLAYYFWFYRSGFLYFLEMMIIHQTFSPRELCCHFIWTSIH